ncbi:MAG: hypothetical protein AAF487_10885 [Bacteroidota bacterium]
MKCYSQSERLDTKIQLMNGKLLDVSLGDTSGANIFYSALKKNQTWIKKSIYKDQVFSLFDLEGNETVLYRQNEIIGDEYTIQQMRTFILGERDALNGYSAKGTFYGGLALGLGGGYASKGGVLLPASIPLIYSLSMQLPYIRIKEKSVSNMQIAGQEHYLIGYEKTARTRKTMNAILGSLLGAAIGTTVYELTH